jgi:hypothetical protein
MKFSKEDTGPSSRRALSNDELMAFIPAALFEASHGYKETVLHCLAAALGWRSPSTN